MIYTTSIFFINKRLTAYFEELLEKNYPMPIPHKYLSTLNNG